MAVRKLLRAASDLQTNPVGGPNWNTIRVDPSTDTLVFGTGTSGTSEKTVVDTTSTQTLSNKTLTSPVITGAGATSSGVVVSATVPFVETVGFTTLTGTVAIPAGSTIVNIQIMSTVLWGGTSASLVVGDTGSANGYFTATDLKATDLLVGEVLSTQGGVQTWGGRNGAYLVSASGRMGPTAAGDSGPYYGVADSIIGVITQGTPSTTGRTFMTVTYTKGTVVAPVLT